LRSGRIHNERVYVGHRTINTPSRSGSSFPQLTMAFSRREEFVIANFFLRALLQEYTAGVHCTLATAGFFPRVFPLVVAG
jgi:hypothetical protein